MAQLGQHIEQSLLLLQCSELAEKLAEDVTSEGLKGRTITLKLKTTNFEVRTRAATLPRHISAYDDIFREATRLLRAELPITIRLMVSLQCFLDWTPCFCMPYSIGEREINDMEVTWDVSYVVGYLI